MQNVVVGLPRREHARPRVDHPGKRLKRGALHREARARRASEAVHDVHPQAHHAVIPRSHRPPYLDLERRPAHRGIADQRDEQCAQQRAHAQRRSHPRRVCRARFGRRRVGRPADVDERRDPGQRVEVPVRGERAMREPRRDPRQHPAPAAERRRVPGVDPERECVSDPEHSAERGPRQHGIPGHAERGEPVAERYHRRDQRLGHAARPRLRADHEER